MDQKDSILQDTVMENYNPHHQEVLSDYLPDTDEERKLVRKIDLYLLPAIWFMYLLSYMDRTK